MTALEIATTTAQRKPIRVHVVRYKDRTNLMLRYADPGTGRKVCRTAGTSDRREAKDIARQLAARLNDPSLDSLRALIENPTPHNERAGVVYFIRSVTGNLKIGWSAEPDRRVGQLLSILEFPAEPVAFMAGTRTDERAVHYALRASRIVGKREWFSATEEVRAFIQKRAQAVEGDWRLFLLERFS